MSYNRKLVPLCSARNIPEVIEQLRDYDNRKKREWYQNKKKGGSLWKE